MQECTWWYEWFRAEWSEIRFAAEQIRSDGNRRNVGGAETCVSCGETIPEGRQVCPGCERRVDKS